MSIISKFSGCWSCYLHEVLEMHIFYFSKFGFKMARWCQKWVFLVKCEWNSNRISLILSKFTQILCISMPFNENVRGIFWEALKIHLKIVIPVDHAVLLWYANQTDIQLNELFNKMHRFIKFWTQYSLSFNRK